MNLQQIRTKAAALGVGGISRMRKRELVHAIQVREGNSPCYGADWRFDCQQFDCCWREDCQRSIPA